MRSIVWNELRNILDSSTRNIGQIVELADGVIAARDHAVHRFLGGQDVVFVAFDTKTFEKTGESSASGIFTFLAGVTLEGAKQKVAENLRRRDGAPISWFEPWIPIVPRRQKLTDAFRWYGETRQPFLPPFSVVEISSCGVFLTSWEEKNGVFRAFFDKDTFSSSSDISETIQGFPPDIGLILLDDGTVSGEITEKIAKRFATAIRNYENEFDWTWPPRLIYPFSLL